MHEHRTAGRGERPRLAGAVATSRAERVAVFVSASVDRRARPPAIGPTLIPGANVVVAVSIRAARPALIELEPASVLRLASALLAATEPDHHEAGSEESG